VSTAAVQAKKGKGDGIAKSVAGTLIMLAQEGGGGPCQKRKDPLRVMDPENRPKGVRIRPRDQNTCGGWGEGGKERIYSNGVLRSFHKCERVCRQSLQERGLDFYMGVAFLESRAVMVNRRGGGGAVLFSIDIKEGGELFA